MSCMLSALWAHFNSHNESMSRYCYCCCCYFHLRVRKHKQEWLSNWGHPAKKCMLGAELWGLTLKPVLLLTGLNSSAPPHSHPCCHLPQLRWHCILWVTFQSPCIWHKNLVIEWVDMYMLRFSFYEIFQFSSINNLGTNLCIKHFMNNWYDL